MAAWGEALIEKRLGKDTNPSCPQSKTTQNKTKKHQIEWRGKKLCQGPNLMQLIIRKLCTISHIKGIITFICVCLS